jgi:hypothetical protein
MRLKQFARPVIYDLMVLNRRRDHRHCDFDLNLSRNQLAWQTTQNAQGPQSDRISQLRIWLEQQPPDPENGLTGTASCRGHRDRAAFLCRACNSFHVPLSGTGFLFPRPAEH